MNCCPGIGKSSRTWRPVRREDQKAVQLGGWLLIHHSPLQITSKAQRARSISSGARWGPDSGYLQSIWSAASVRRNATLPGLPVNPSFIYRMIEIYLQEPRVPRLKEIRSIKLATTAKANLAERLTRALRPILAGAQETIPVQLRQGVESVRLSKATENAGGAAAFPPEPDPKVQWILEISEADVPETAQRLANSLTQIVQGEPLGATADVQLILSVVVWTEKQQPILEIS